MQLGKELFGKGKNIEFKGDIPKRHENFLKDIIAFSNASGGMVILGIEMAHQFVLRHINCGAIIDGLYRRDVYELPTSSIREMIINAVLHRSYLDESSIQVSLYDDRLEIDSPGMLYDGLTIEEAKSGKSRCRNKAIAEAFQYMKLIEGWGTGLPRLYKNCNEMGLLSPRFEEFGDGLKVTIYRNSVAVEKTGCVTVGINGGDVVENQPDVVENQPDVVENQTSVVEKQPDVVENQTSVVEKLLDALRHHPDYSASELSAIFHRSQRQTHRLLSQLKSDGHICRIGSDKGGHWEVLKDE